MNAHNPVSEPASPVAEISVAGETAWCDRRGALYFPELGLLCVSVLHLE